MNLNEQLQQAYNAGRRQGLNEQRGMAPMPIESGPAGRMTPPEPQLPPRPEYNEWGRNQIDRLQAQYEMEWSAWWESLTKMQKYRWIRRNSKPYEGGPPVPPGL